MKRKFDVSTILSAIKHIRYLFLIIFRIKNWVNFVSHYVGMKEGGAEYILRNGIKIKTKDAISSATIAVVFIKKDYGDVPENSVVIDIGANIGVYSIFSTISEGTVVYAYEPMIDNFNLLKENVKLNNLDNKILLFNLAVAGKKEKRKLYLGESPLHSFLPIEDSPFNALYNIGNKIEQEYSEVNCVSLKDIFDDNKIKYCNILKIDCEGAEYDILYNLPKEYFSKIGNIKLEYHNHKDNIKNSGEYLSKFLLENGFTIEEKKEGSSYQGDIWLKNILMKA